MPIWTTVIGIAWRGLRNAAGRPRNNGLSSLINRGHAHEDAGQVEHALACYDKVIAISPSLAEAHLNRGNALVLMGRLEEAQRAYTVALHHDAKNAAAHFNIGNIHLRLDRPLEALTSYKQALALKPDFEAARLALSYVEPRPSTQEDSDFAYRRALAATLEQTPHDANARWAQAMAHARPIYNTAQEMAQSCEDFMEAIQAISSDQASFSRSQVGSALPFHLAYHPRNVLPLLSPYGDLCSQLMRQDSAAQLIVDQPPSGKKLRIGIVSAHFHEQSVWSAITKGWLLQLDRSKFELIAFQVGGHNKNDTETSFARANTLQFVEGPYSEATWVKRIQELRPNVLLYPEIGMDGMTLKLAAQRLAPLQAASWGHPLTTALPTIDLFLSADAIEPPNAQSHYREKLIRLPNLGVSTQPFSQPPFELDLASCGLPDNEPLLICPGMLFKYNPEHDAVWVALAHDLETLGMGRLVFFRSDNELMTAQFERRLRHAFENGAVNFDRTVCLINHLPRPAFFSLLRRSCAMLDTIGFSGFNTAMQAFECGLPVVAFEGEFMRGRFASALARRMGLDELVATTAAGFVDIASRLVKDHAYRASICREVSVRKSVLFNDAAPVHAMGRILMEMSGLRDVVGQK